MTEEEKAIREALPVVAHMRADGSAWGAFGSCRPGDVGSFAVVRLSDAESHLAALRSEVKRLREDAERYRFIRRRKGDFVVEHHRPGWATCYGPKELDAAIDAARAALGKEQAP